jgi:putative addiction module component (TIGR02574 family)
MNTTKIKEELYEYINQADDRFIQLIYAMVQADKKELGLLDQDEKDELDRRVERHKSGQSKPYTWEEVKARLSQQS